MSWACFTVCDISAPAMPTRPGLVYLYNNFTTLLIAPCIVLTLDLLRRQFFYWSIPIWALVPIYLLSWPTQIFVTVQWRDFTKRREAAKRGARLVPTIISNTIGNYEVLKRFDISREVGYLGALNG